MLSYYLSFLSLKENNIISRILSVRLIIGKVESHQEVHFVHWWTYTGKRMLSLLPWTFHVYVFLLSKSLVYTWKSFLLQTWFAEEEVEVLIESLLASLDAGYVMAKWLQLVCYELQVLKQKYTLRLEVIQVGMITKIEAVSKIWAQRMLLKNSKRKSWRKFNNKMYITRKYLLEGSSRSISTGIFIQRDGTDFLF